MLPIKIYDINCTGNEDFIWDCQLSQARISGCSRTYDDASVACNGNFNKEFL